MAISKGKHSLRGKRVPAAVYNVVNDETLLDVTTLASVYPMLFACKDMGS